MSTRMLSLPQSWLLWKSQKMTQVQQTPGRTQLVGFMALCVMKADVCLGNKCKAGVIGVRMGDVWGNSGL